MATVTTTPQQSSGLNRRSQLWRRIPKICCHREILMLLVWVMLFTLFRTLLLSVVSTPKDVILDNIIMASRLAFLVFTPFFGWLADVKLGRYKVILYATLVSFGASMIFAIQLFTGKTLGNVLSFIGNIVCSLANACFSAAILPFMTDQLIGANAYELSAAIYWFYWVDHLGVFLSTLVRCFDILPEPLKVLGVILSAACLAMIIISDCLCQQWLDRTHKVTNPIKLIIQVLNYTRKNRYPQRRSAFTYLDEEQPSRIDFGKEKFGGPFTEEEVEDVKTVLQLLPLVACLSFSVGSAWQEVHLNPFYNEYINCVLDTGSVWIPPLVLVPLYQFLIYPLFHKWIPSMLRRIGEVMFLQLLGFILCSVPLITGYILSGDLINYLTCKAVNIASTQIVEWYWNLAPQLLQCVPSALVHLVMLEFTIAQSPDKMKGLVFGILIAFQSISLAIGIGMQEFFLYTLCFDVPILVLQTVLLLIFLFLSKHYTLRERNREVNIQAIVEEHYERYLDQEEEYMRERHY